MAELTIGTMLETKKNKQVKILGLLGSGGQGNVYKVDYSGEIKALKWYHENNIVPEKKDFFKNLEKNIKSGPPSPNFIWPLDLTKPCNGSIGYIMDMYPNGDYWELSKYLAGRHFDSFQICVEAMINVVKEFRCLHNKGYSYQDLNDGNFVINPHTGKVFIIDNDNVAPDGYNMGIRGKPRYMAPEIVMEKNKPNKQSDRFSLALILFLMLCKSHPLEGASTTPPCVTPSIEKAIYGENPIFIYDPDNKINRPIKAVHFNAIKMWPLLPDYIKDAFERSFSKETMNLSKPRIIEKEWIDLLTRFRSDIIMCQNKSCQCEEFITTSSFNCSNCGKKVNITNMVNLPYYKVNAFPGCKIYKCQIERNCIEEEATIVIAEIVANPENPIQYGIKNLSEVNWICTTPSGNKKVLPNGGIVPVIKGIKINIFGKDIEIE